MFSGDDERDDYTQDVDADRPADLDALEDWIDLRFGFESIEHLAEDLALCQVDERTANLVAARLLDLVVQYVPDGDDEG